MKRVQGIGLIGAVALAGLQAGCEPAVTREQLAPVVQRDAVPFDLPVIPEEILDRLAPYRLVVVGETHLLEEHRTFVAALVRELHARGFRQLLVEWPSYANWVLEDFIMGSPLEPGWQPGLGLGLRLFEAVRDFNATLAEAERVQVHGIDMNLTEYGGPADFRNSLAGLVTHLPSAGPVAEFLQGDYGSPETQTPLLETLRAALERDAAPLRVSWGEHWYATVVEMVDVEIASVDIRARRESDYDRSVRMREDVIKDLADTRIAKTPHGTIINIGSTHAQKSRLFGTDIEWLGEYLVRRSAVVDGSAFVIGVSAAYIQPAPGSTQSPYDVRNASPPNELHRVMVESFPNRTAFLPLDDPLFATGRVLLNVEEIIYSCAPAEQFDAILQFALAHREPLP
ncbi:MAG: hypothetical protein OEO20_13315 [Gemmatimonadota bacterium]|nr:hypothetical protein [Gemmatimonadota bacterium]MDH3369280.1 hypothetical protein [Gemmatimonadota bacterium]MDH3479272.1 hypothetical protein [Gemmatimonadota bacterium]MDH5549276.1 hypothetical protein [Gemmatimonadota bacterium]